LAAWGPIWRVSTSRGLRMP